MNGSACSSTGFPAKSSKVLAARADACFARKDYARIFSSSNLVIHWVMREYFGAGAILKTFGAPVIFVGKLLILLSRLSVINL